MNPIINLSPNLKQEVKVHTRLNPPAILDPIITTLGTKPPIDPDTDSGKPSDHLIVLMLPLISALQIPPRVYRTVVTRPLTQSGVEKFANWIENYSWAEIYECEDGHRMAELFQNVLLDNYKRIFPIKTLKVCDEDRPWITTDLKRLSRQVKREYFKNRKSEKWLRLKAQFEEKCSLEKQRYYDNIVSDLKMSNPGQWYSKVKRMSGKIENKQQNILVDE